MQSIMYGIHTTEAQRMLDYDFLCDNPPSVSAFLSPGDSKQSVVLLYGTTPIRIPIIQSFAALSQFPTVDRLINLASFRTATQVIRDAYHYPQIHHIATIAEGIPERDTRKIIASKPSHVTLYGPASVGGLVAGHYRIANTGGTIDNIIASRLYRPGSIGLVTKSGGMLNELCRMISRTTDGVHTAIALGGDRFPYQPFADICLQYEQNPHIKIIILFGEVGTRDEIAVADFITQKKITKPVIARIVGESQVLIGSDVQFGHAGAKANKIEETAAYKNIAIRQAGAYVPDNFADLEGLCAQVFTKYTPHKQIAQTQNVPEYITERSQILHHRQYPVFSTRISDERGDELVYGKTPVSTFVAQKDLIGTICMLRFGRDISKKGKDFFLTAFIILADHGPAVSGATNAIITARAGKDCISSLIAGLTTIGPRFGGAISGMMQSLWDAKKQGLTPQTFVETMKKKGELIPGIGHKIKSIYNPDKRCELLATYGNNFETIHNTSATFFLFAKEIESITTKKRPTLILNVDGHIAAILLDMLGEEGFSEREIENLLRADIGNCIFALARTIGFLGHHIDQVSHDEGLYRTPWEHIWYE